MLRQASRRARGLAALLVVLLLVAPRAQAQEVDYAGTSVANFLKIPVGARNMAMAGSDLTMAYDATALYWNPGTITLLPKNAFTFSYVPWLVDSQINYVAGVYHLGANSFGLDLHFFDSGDIEETTLAEQDGTGRFVNAMSYQLGLAYSRAFTDRFAFGMKVKYVRESLANVDAGAFGVDVGAVFRTGLLRDLQLAFALTNFGTKMQFAGRDLRVTYPIPDNPGGKSVPAQMQTGEWDLPLSFRLGASSNLINTSNYRMKVNYSVFDTRDYRPQHLLGGEIMLYDLMALRGGYNVRAEENYYTLGAGLQVGLSDVARLHFDYSYMQQSYLANVHQLTVSVSY